MTVATVETMSYAEYAGWVRFFTERNRPAAPGPDIDLATATPDQLRGLFG